MARRWDITGPGFDVVGVDIRPQPRYPFEFHRADVIFWGTAGFDAIHASPPCQRYSRATRDPSRHPDLLDDVRVILKGSGVPWVIENVPGAPMRPDLILCGCMFGLPNLKRERWFETSWGAFDMRSPCDHREPVITVAGTGAGNQHSRAGRRGFDDWRRAMDIDWMTGKELAQAVPPAYTEYIGRQLLDHLSSKGAVASR